MFKKLYCNIWGERVKIEHLNYKVSKVNFFKKVPDELTFKYVSQ
jgi:hypothetical protein